MKTQRILNLLTNISTVVMLVFLYLFVSRNAPGLTQLYAIIALALVYAFIYLAATAGFLSALTKAPGPQAGGWFWRLLLAGCSVLLVYVFIGATLSDYYQPLSLYDEAIGLLALWWLLLVVQNLIALFAPAHIARAAAGMALAAVLAWPLAASLWWVNRPAADSTIPSSAVFSGGEDGYRVYRIPGLALIPAGSTLANGDTQGSDRLLAFAEARRDGALDTGDIDLVLKTSDDNGHSWTPQAIICQHRVDGARAKCGNPTPVFDQRTGKLILAYNLSGPGVSNRHHSSHIMVSDDGGGSWGKGRQLADDDFIFGPGKGLLKTNDSQQRQVAASRL